MPQEDLPSTTSLSSKTCLIIPSSLFFSSSTLFFYHAFCFPQLLLFRPVSVPPAIGNSHGLGLLQISRPSRPAFLPSLRG